jgi:hypothetical protein
MPKVNYKVYTVRVHIDDMALPELDIEHTHVITERVSRPSPKIAAKAVINKAGNIPTEFRPYFLEAQVSSEKPPYTDDYFLYAWDDLKRRWLRWDWDKNTTVPD